MALAPFLYRFSLLIGALGIVGAAALPIAAEAGVKQTTAYRHYKINGKSALELVLYMGRYGPVVGHERAYGDEAGAA